MTRRELFRKLGQVVGVALAAGVVGKVQAVESKPELTEEEIAYLRRVKEAIEVDKGVEKGVLRLSAPITTCTAPCYPSVWNSSTSTYTYTPTPLTSYLSHST